MTTISNIAQRILDENNYTTSDISLVNLEYLIKNAVDHINLQAGTNVVFTPSGGTQSLTGTDSEILIVKTLSALLIRAYKDRGPNTAIQGLAVTTLITDPQYNVFMKILDEDISRLRGRSFKRT